MKRRLPTLPSDGECISVDIGLDERGLPLDALVVRTPSGELRAYQNICKHIPIPIDSGSGEYLSDDGEFLFCGTHGALYRLEDGVCVEGPCKGERLDPVELEQVGDDWFVVGADDSD